MPRGLPVVLVVLACLLIALSLAARPSPSLAQQPPAIVRVSVASDGTQANGASRFVSMSADGRYVAFASTATNLIPSDTNGAEDIFLHDRTTGETRRISIGLNGSEANGESRWPVISLDGCCVVFSSRASNLISNDTNLTWDVFLFDIPTGETELISVALNGEPGNSASIQGTLSADGRFVMFNSSASNLVDMPPPGSPTSNVFYRDRQTGETTAISLRPDGELARTGGAIGTASRIISSDNRYMLFVSSSDDLDGGGYNNLSADVYLYDRLAGTLERISKTWNGDLPTHPSDLGAISLDGTYIWFYSYDPSLVNDGITIADRALETYVYNRVTGELMRSFTFFGGSRFDALYRGPVFSASTQYAAYVQERRVISAEAGQVLQANGYLYDLASRTKAQVDLPYDGIESAREIEIADFTSDGRYVAFLGIGNNLVPGDTNGVRDVFVRDMALTWPLAVHLASFSAERQPAHVVLQWRTESEVGLLGFNLYRPSPTNPSLPGQRLNTTLIAAQAPGSSEGASYAWAVKETAGHISRCYLLEAVEASGTTWHGPACARWALWLPLTTR
jgi:Tol biopolymer transport system component